MIYKKIKVTSYSGHKAHERPKNFILHGREINVVEISDMWIEEELMNKGRKRFFKILGNDGYEYKIYFDEQKAGWFLAKVY